MKVTIRLIASEAQYEDHGNGAPIPQEQPDALTLGSFDISFVQLTYQYLRIGEDGDHIAEFFTDGFWRLLNDGIRQIEHLPRAWRDFPLEDAKFTDIGISFDEDE